MYAFLHIVFPLRPVAKGTLFCKGNVSLDGEGMEDFGERFLIICLMY